MIVLNLLASTLLLATTALAGRVKYEVRYYRSNDHVRTSRSSTLNMPDRHLNLVASNMETWSSGRFRGFISGYHEDMVVVRNSVEVTCSNNDADALLREMALVVLCNIPGDAGAASVTGFNRRQDCKKKGGRN